MGKKTLVNQSARKNREYFNIEGKQDTYFIQENLSKFSVRYINSINIFKTLYKYIIHVLSICLNS